mmetsp:Transcript_80336/g.126722  ORF Transcript_80336/g.126722 Transcript_80336/m.126722 type:complete len:242 (-) Transcript_80336:132-857(-)
MCKNFIAFFAISCVAYGHRKKLVASRELSHGLQVRSKLINARIAKNLDAFSRVLLTFAQRAAVKPPKLFMRSGPLHSALMTDANYMKLQEYDNRERALQRRAMLGRGVAFILGLSLGDVEASAVEADAIQDIERLGEKAKSLRAEIRKRGRKTAARASSDLTDVLQPLQAKMKNLAPNRDAKLLANEMEGHLLEFKEALEKNQWEPYVDEETKTKYLGGRPDAELEEVEETLEAYLKLVKV